MHHMNKNLQSPTKLTEFAPIQTEEKQTGVGQLITKIFKFSRSPQAQSSNDFNSTSVDTDPHDSLPSWAIDSATAATPDSVYQVDINEGRSLPNVLKRISNLLALKSNSLQDYSDTELKQYWMPDSVSKECYECCEKFTTFRRRHHCRVCGQIFCSQCCSQQIPGKIFGCTGDLRVCTYCCKVVLSYLESSDDGSAAGLVALVQDSCMLQDVDKVQDFAEINNYFKRKISVGYQEENFAASGYTMSSNRYLTTEEKCKALQNSVSLRTLFEEMTRGTTCITLGTHKYRLRTYMDCFLGSELVDWLIFQQKSNTRVQASAICQALLEGGYIECISDPSSFVDGYALYKPIFTSPFDDVSSTVNDFFEDDPVWVQQIPTQDSSTTDSENEYLIKNRRQLSSSSSYTLDMNLQANSVYLSRPPVGQLSDSNSNSMSNVTSPTTATNSHETDVTIKTSEQRELVPEAGWHNALSSLREDNGEKEAYNLLEEAYRQHEQMLLEQLLLSNSLSLTWTDIILPLCHEVIDVVRPDKTHNAEDLDIRHYVKVKKLPHGVRSDSEFIRGIVCSKNVAHKGMSIEIKNAKILLLQCSIVYQRAKGRLMSLEPVLMQEHEFLRHVVARIAALQPDVVLVHQNVSRLAQDLLRENGITLVYNVKETILEQLSRCTGADLVTAVDAHIGRPRLGQCKLFYLKRFNIGSVLKTCMFFEGLSFGHLGGTILLRGASRKVLSKIEEVLLFFLFTTYNWRLEKSFLMDEFAQPPNSEFVLDDTITDIKKMVESATVAQAAKATYAPQSKKIEVKSVEDFTDPLHSSVPSSLEENEKMEESSLSNNFRKCLIDTILATSPFITFSLPYLETDVGKRCKLRKFFPSEIYFSEQFIENSSKVKKMKCHDFDNQTNTFSQATAAPLHPFLVTKLTMNVDSNEIQSMLANFRACGGMYRKKQVFCIEKETDKEIVEKEIYNKQDVFEIKNHQRLSVLFCSFSHESNNAPAFCVNPWIVTMNFYGSNDIPLGCFLERYCFRSTYTCPSKTCGTPMLKHVRRFVHNAGCVSISLNHFENAFSEENIVMWSCCTKCQGVSSLVAMSSDTWSFSFAKYLELKFYGGLYSRRGSTLCKHSLHYDHYQYFGYRNMVATFKYTAIKIWDISLPPPLIEIFDTNQTTEMIDEIRTMAQKGHEIFSLILEKLSCTSVVELDGLGNLIQLLLSEQTQFKQKVEQVQLKLTSPTIEINSVINQDHSPFWKISDSLNRIKRVIVETVDMWNTRLSEAVRKRDSFSEKKKDKLSDLDSPVAEVDIKHHIVTSASLDQAESEDVANVALKCHQRSQSDGTVMSLQQHSDIVEQIDVKKDSDKKTVKNILSQLLPSSSTLILIHNPFSTQEHYTLPTGVYSPIVVYESEPSSIIAYSLNSYDYKKLFDDLSIKKSEQSTPSPVVKRKNTSQSTSSVELNDAIDDSKKTIPAPKNQHIEIQFQDVFCNFFCRIYFAEKFADLRAQVVPIGEEAYIRSLARSVQWNARGGKSGSNFSKTADDRFILKEMSKSEVQLFLESAPNYFNYMSKCFATGQPTLLGKIVGIYQIIFKNSTNITSRNNLLVMENLFYNRKVVQKFDLKGSMRNRLVIPDNDLASEVVLLDENLLKMTCDAPLYILPHSKAVLTAAIQNDTEFLSAQSVMDYSLLVGLDSENSELILGIIDYIRTFTWDKKLETMVKKSGILGGQGKLPTIISPEEYQKRFIEAMHRYFLEVPDHWAGLGKGLEF